MKKLSVFLALVLIISLWLTNTSFSQEIIVDIAGQKSTYKGTLYNLELNGLWIPTQTPCIVISGVAYVPLREVFQDYLGMTVGYDNNTRTAYVQKGKKGWISAWKTRLYIKTGQKWIPVCPWQLSTEIQWFRFHSLQDISGIPYR